MKHAKHSQRAPIEKEIQHQPQRPAKVFPGVSSFSPLQAFRRAAMATALIATAGLMCVLPLAARAGKATEETSRQSLVRADRAFAEAAVNGNAHAAASLLGPRFTWTNRDGKTWSRAQALAHWKMLGATAEGESGSDARVYGRVGVVTGMGKVRGAEVRFGRVWIAGPKGWKAMVYQANPVMKETPAGAPVSEKGPATCINPCKEVPYEPKTATVHSVVASWQALETANFGHDAQGWADHVSEDFMLIRPNGRLLDKADRMRTIRYQKAHSIVVHVPTAQWVRVRVFGDTAVMIAHHHLPNGTPYRATRVWILRDGVWKLSLSQQTIIR